VVVTSAKWPIKNGLRVGVPVSRVLKALGGPGDVVPLLQYNGESEHVEFTVSRGHVTRIEFDHHAE
jgi:hypothetical protein